MKKYEDFTLEQKAPFLVLADRFLKDGPVDRERLAAILYDNGMGSMRALFQHVENVLGAQVKYLLDTNDMAGIRVIGAQLISLLDLSEQLVGPGAMPKAKEFAESLEQLVKELTPQPPPPPDN